jgi:hypothetical protein
MRAASVLTTLGYWVQAPGRGDLRPTELGPVGAGQVRLAARCTGISSGTERLVGTGRVPASAASTMAVPGMQGSFALPILYGYSFVGTVLDGAERGRRVFTMHPHTDHAVVAASSCVPLFEAIPDARATLLPNLETAVNAVWDAELVGGEPVAVFGGGAVGLLVAFVLAGSHHGDVVLVESDPARASFAARLPWVRAVVPTAAQLPQRCAVAFHATGSGEGLQAAIDACAFEGRIVELSWYGDRPVALRLGEAFHWNRLRLVGSQVGTVAKLHRAAGRAGRTSSVLALLCDERLDAMLLPATPFAACVDLFASLYRGEAVPVAPVLVHDPGPHDPGNLDP